MFDGDEFYGTVSVKMQELLKWIDDEEELDFHDIMMHGGDEQWFPIISQNAYGDFVAANVRIKSKFVENNNKFFKAGNIWFEGEHKLYSFENMNWK